MKVAAVFVNPVLFAFSFSRAMDHTAFTTLADRAVHVLGQFQHFNQICKLLHGKCIVVNAKVGEEQTSFLFFGAAIVVHGILCNTSHLPGKKLQNVLNSANLI